MTSENDNDNGNVQVNAELMSAYENKYGQPSDTFLTEIFGEMETYTENKLHIQTELYNVIMRDVLDVHLNRKYGKEFLFDIMQECVLEKIVDELTVAESGKGKQEFLLRSILQNDRTIYNILKNHVYDNPRSRVDLIINDLQKHVDIKKMNVKKEMTKVSRLAEIMSRGGDGSQLVGVSELSSDIKDNKSSPLLGLPGLSTSRDELNGYKSSPLSGSMSTNILQQTPYIINLLKQFNASTITGEMAVIGGQKLTNKYLPEYLNVDDNGNITTKKEIIDKLFDILIAFAKKKEYGPELLKIIKPTIIESIKLEPTFIQKHLFLQMLKNNESSIYKEIKQNILDNSTDSDIVNQIIKGFHTHVADMKKGIDVPKTREELETTIKKP